MNCAQIGVFERGHQTLPQILEVLRWQKIGIGHLYCSHEQSRGPVAEKVVCESVSPWISGDSSVADPTRKQISLT